MIRLGRIGYANMAPKQFRALLDRLGGEVGLCVDFGNYKGPRKYQDLAAIMPRAGSIHAKAHFPEAGQMDRDDFVRCLDLSRDAGFSGPSKIIVYGPGDEQISLLLRMVRSPSPVVPRIGDQLTLDRDDPGGNKELPVRGHYESNGIHIEGDTSMRQGLTFRPFRCTIPDAVAASRALPAAAALARAPPHTVTPHPVNAPARRDSADRPSRTCPRG